MSTRVKLAYGKTGMWLDIPSSWNVTVVEPQNEQGLPDPAIAITTALRDPWGCPPITELVRDSPVTSPRIGIIFSDITRPTPNHIILPPILAELESAGVPRERITLFNALGTHRANTDAELRAMLGDTLVDGYRIVQNDAFDVSTQIYLGCSSRGHAIWLNRELVECDIKILTGFIEPHFFAGFSGGGKAVMPGMAGLRTVLGNHDAQMIGHPNATWGITHGNPIWEEAREVALRSGGNQFLLNVSLNSSKQITGVFAGDLDAAHSAGCAYVKQTAMVAVPHPFDIVITTNSGYPLDMNLYQTVKGMCAAAQVVRQGGAIIAAAECADGIPDHGLYGKLLREATSPQQLLDTINKPGFLEQDQWEAQIQALVQLKADVYVHTAGLTDLQITEALLKPCHNIVATVENLLLRYGAHAPICIMPQGPQTIAYTS